jgi:hypothetical protein
MIKIMKTFHIIDNINIISSIVKRIFKLIILIIVFLTKIILVKWLNEIKVKELKIYQTIKEKDICNITKTVKKKITYKFKITVLISNFSHYSKI